MGVQSYFLRLSVCIEKSTSKQTLRYTEEMVSLVERTWYGDCRFQFISCRHKLRSEWMWRIRRRKKIHNNLYPNIIYKVINKRTNWNLICKHQDVPFI